MLDSFFFNDTATTEIYTLSLHDALPILPPRRNPERHHAPDARVVRADDRLHRRQVPALELREVPAGRPHADNADEIDRKSTRLNSSHANISYAVFCLKKKTRRRDELAVQ